MSRPFPRRSLALLESRCDRPIPRHGALADPNIFQGVNPFIETFLLSIGLISILSDHKNHKFMEMHTPCMPYTILGQHGDK